MSYGIVTYDSLRQLFLNSFASKDQQWSRLIDDRNFELIYRYFHQIRKKVNNLKSE